jgi:hypothetical protein
MKPKAGTKIHIFQDFTESDRWVLEGIFDRYPGIPYPVFSAARMRGVQGKCTFKN